MGIKKLDSDQKKAVASEKNAVVSAGAGSGKTTVLSERYIRLIVEGKAAVENILTLTFTRKAAVEMYDRIYRKLLDLKDSKMAKLQAARFENARISTLDSFSAEIVRNGSLRFGIPMDFTTDMERIEALASDGALEFILRHQDNIFLKNFISLHGFENVYEKLFIPIAVNYFNIADPVDFAGTFQIQKMELERVFGEKIKKLEEFRQKIVSMEPINGKTFLENQEICRRVGPLNFSDISQDTDNISEILSGLKLNLRVGKSPEAEVQKAYIINIRTEMEILSSILSSFSGLPLVGGIFELLDEFQKEFIQKKRSSALLTFQDVATMAVKILEEDLELRRFYKKQFSYIMIDEFQDNNLLQKNLLFLLAEKEGKENYGIPEVTRIEPDKLFFVGDEKQSIYSFRGADVSVFKKLKDEILSSGGEFLSLNTNYRSEPALIDFFNSLFQTVMAESTEHFEAVFESLKSRAASEKVSPSIRFFYKPYKTDMEILGGKEAEAWHIARYIQFSVENKELLIPDGKNGVRPAEYRDIALLMRSTSDQILYEKYLRKLNIPFVVQSVRALFMEAPINDLYNFLQLLVYPFDRSAYAGLLRSPFINLNDDVSTRILMTGTSAFDIDADMSSAIFSTTSDLEKYKLGQDLYFRLLKIRDSVPKTELIRILWYESGYRYLLLKNPLYSGYLEYFDYLEELAERSDRKGENLALFLDFIRRNLGKYEKIPDLELLRDETAGVQFMTIHKSKGLEFPVVIVADTGNSGTGIDDGMPFFVSEKFGISLKVGGDKGKKANYFFSLAKEESMDKLVAETKRILYVALTRAESHLILSGVHGKNNHNPDNYTGRRTLLNMIINGLGKENGFTEEIPDYTENDINSTAQSQKIIDIDTASRLYKEYERVERKAGTIIYTATEINRIYTEKTNQRNGRRLTAIDSDVILDRYNLSSSFGTLCHRIIEARLKGTEFDEFRLREFDDISVREREIIFSDAGILVDRFFKSHFYDRIHSAAGYESEFSFLYRVSDNGNSFYINGQVDMIIEKDDEVIVIDFKTDLYKNPAEYAAQLTVYREAVSGIYGKPVKSFLFYLREGEAVSLNNEVNILDCLQKNPPDNQGG